MKESDIVAIEKYLEEKARLDWCYGKTIKEEKIYLGLLEELRDEHSETIRKLLPTRQD
jgi:hypothetical protein